MTKREQLVAVVRGYMDTPYGDHGRMPGPDGQLDCIGMLVCGAREVGLVAPDFDVPEYLAQPDGVTMMKWAALFLGPQVERVGMRPGDVLVVKPGTRPQHIALVGDHPSGQLSMIHASNIAFPPRVVESRLDFARSTLIFVAAFAMPGIDE